MIQVTKQFIKNEDISIESIKRRLEQISDAIRKSNQMNLTDINVICEEIFGQILNLIYDLELTSMTANVSGNFIAVDLVDYKKKIAFQVTSRIDKRKIDETVRKFNKSELADKIDSLYILILNRKSFEAEDIMLDSGKLFSYQENIIDIGRLIRLVENSGHEIIVKVYEIINMVFDSGRLVYKNVIKSTEELTSNILVESYDTALWKLGYGAIQLSAFLPMNYKQEVSCCVEIRKHDLAGMFLTLNQSKLMEDYFVSEEEFIEKHCVGRVCVEEDIWIQLENVRLNINAHTAYHIYQLFSELYVQYRKSIRKINQILGTDNMEKKEDKYLLRNVTIEQWLQMLRFADAHNGYMLEGNLEENIFLTSSDRTKIILVPNVNSNKKGDIWAELSVKASNASSGVLEVWWTPGYRAAELDCMEGFDNVIKWRADHTLNWMNCWMLPTANEYNTHTKHGLGSWYKAGRLFLKNFILGSKKSKK